MQHDVPPTIQQALAGLELAEPRPARPGLWVAAAVRVDRSEAGTAGSEAAPPASGSLAWVEAVPPEPSGVLARNQSRQAVIVLAGTLLAGGMSDRVVRRSRVLPPGAVLRVATEPVGARWFDEGALRAQGHTDPVVTALVLQAVHGRGHARHAARVALWSAAAGQVDGARWGEARGPGAGWVVGDDDGVLAAWLPPAIAGEQETRDATARAHDARLARLARRIAQGLRDGTISVHHDDTGDARPATALVPRTLRLVDRLLAA